MSAVQVIDRDADRFAGRWVSVGPGDELPDLAGRVAVLGDPAGVVQVAPRLVGGPELVKVFYADPVWVLPTARGASTSPTWRPGAAEVLIGAVRRLLPGSSDAPADPVAAAAEQFLQAEVADAWIRRQLTPHPQDVDAPVVRSDGFFAALAHVRCELITWPVAAIAEHGVRTADGLEHRVDAIVAVG